MSDAINGDISVRAVVDTARMGWASSPSGSVWRKRVHLVGPPESGQVTSVVRYEPTSKFHAHDHPDGEEILVLDGVFSDEHGDWPAGTYLLNPEGFHHAPFSRPGCELFVKLRQFPGRARNHIVIDTHALAWPRSAQAGVTHKPLYAQAGFTDVTRLERFESLAAPGLRTYHEGAEIFVLEGAFRDEVSEYGPGAWLRLPSGASHSPRALAAGCTLYVKEGGLRYLHAAT